MAWTRSSTERVKMPLDVGHLDYRRQRLFGHPPRLQKAWKVRPLAQLGDAQFHRAGAGFPVAIPVAVALDQPLARPFAMAGAG